MNGKKNSNFMKLKLFSLTGRMSLSAAIVRNGRQIPLFHLKGFWLGRQGRDPEWGCHRQKKLTVHNEAIMS